MPSSSSTFGKQLCTLCGSTFGLWIRGLYSNVSASVARLCTVGQPKSVISMSASRTTMQCISSPQLQGSQWLCMRWWIHGFDVYGLHVQFLCIRKSLPEVPRSWCGISKSLAICWHHLASGCLHGSLAMEVEPCRTTGGGGTMQDSFQRTQGANSSSGANPLAALSLGDVSNPLPSFLLSFLVCFTFANDFQCNFLQKVSFGEF